MTVVHGWPMLVLWGLVLAVVAPGVGFIYWNLARDLFGRR